MRVLFTVAWLVVAGLSYADVIKPTLVEISFNENHIELQLETNIEAILTDIGTQYQNSVNAPNADEYDSLRKLKAHKLADIFLQNEDKLLHSFTLKINNKTLNLVRKSVKVDEVGYTQRPRKSIITYQASVTNPQTLYWKFSETYGDNALRFRFVVPDEYTWQDWNYLKSGEHIEIDVIKFKPLSVWQTFIKFISLGFYHVIPLGLDHILFIITMALGMLSLGKTIVLVSSFTLAHTATLALATYDVVTLSPSVIEPIIALSIAVMALDKIVFKLNYKYQSVLVFGFGLLHGLGFALMLKEFISNNLITSLIGFNLGVELAQVLIVILGIIILWLAQRIKLDKVVVIISSLAIFITGMMMFFERI
jgi:hypothetical protein